MNFFERLKQSLQKTRQNFSNRLDKSFNSQEKITEKLYEDLEEILISADVGVKSSIEIVKTLKQNIKSKKIKYINDAKEELILIIENILKSDSINNSETMPTIFLVLGVNGVGKTTTIAKLAHYFKKQGKSVILGAADTFRAAAIEQLLILANKAGCNVVHHKEGADPAAVVFDTVVAAKKRNVDIAICDTAGRLHTKKNLMSELQKIVKVVDKEASNLNKEFLLILDATTGQNGIIQAEKFKEYANITGIALTKLDGTAKGGIIIPIKNEMNVPIKFIGTGEDLEDLQPFDANMFTKALFQSKE